MKAACFPMPARRSCAGRTSGAALRSRGSSTRCSWTSQARMRNSAGRLRYWSAINWLIRSEMPPLSRWSRWGQAISGVIWFGIGVCFWAFRKRRFTSGSMRWWHTGLRAGWWWTRRGSGRGWVWCFGGGGGLASFLEARWSERVVRFEFSSASKSDLGWDFVGVIETGRFKDHADDQSAEYRQFWYEVDKCQYEVLDGPGQRLRWGVTEPPAYDGLVARGHDDLLISAAFTAVLDKQPKPTEYFGAVVQVEKRVSRRRGKY